MQFKLLTYNLLFDSALKDIKRISEVYKPDIMCFQEMETKEENFHIVEECGYKLADYSNCFLKFNKIYGLATFYNPNVFHFKESKSLNLPQSLTEMILILLRGGNKPRTVLRTEFRTQDESNKITVYNLHLTPWATNGVRAKQIRETLKDFSLDHSKNFLIAGDFNYPYGRKKFEKLIQEHHLSEATSNLEFTLEQRFLRFLYVKLKLDYILFKNMELLETKRIEDRSSDHFPILASFNITSS